MSDTTASSARSVSLITIIFLFVLFGSFLFTARCFYRPANLAPQNAAAENLPKELEWRATAESRRQAYAELRNEQIKQESSYAWIDQNAGVLRLPIDRAMQLTAEKYGAQK